MRNSGICQWCNKRHPLKGGKVIRHVKPGTRIPCAPDNWEHHNLPKTELNKVFSEKGKLYQRITFRRCSSW